MTWSIIFHDRSSGRIAIAVATKFFAVGARVPHIEPQTGAVATQALFNSLYGVDGLKLIGDGFSVAGNMLAGPQVVSETVRVLRERSDLELPRRLISALKAGEKVGGDK